MKIIVFGDIHENINQIYKIPDLITASCIIITGDITNQGGAEEAETIIQQVRQLNSKVYAQAGNFDQREVEDYLIKQGISLHGNGFLLENIGIFGVGGSNKSPSNTPNEFSEIEIEYFIHRAYKQILKAPFKLLITHAPPLNTSLDMIRNGIHVGSDSIRRFIDSHQPDICISGHIHESKGKDQIGKTLLFNPGMFKTGSYVEILKEKNFLSAQIKGV